MGLVFRGSVLYYRRRVPVDIRAIVGRAEIWKSLRTDSKAIAIRRLSAVVAKVDAEFEYVRKNAGLTVDRTLLEPLEDDPATFSRYDSSLNFSPSHTSLGLRNEPCPTLTNAYDRYLGDPTFSWSETTRQAYETTRSLVVSILGENMAIASVSRSEVRQLIDVLQHLPRNAVKLFPKLSPREASDLARSRADVERISAANANAYLGRFSNFMNWCVREELIDRNPARGLRLPDDVAKRDKRHPFSPQQLKLIFHAPLFIGCQDGDRGYAKVGTVRPQNARYWVPLIGIHSGMRLNEICQLDTTDIRAVEGIDCICITTSSLVGSTDKKLKTSGSERLIPLHPTLIELGLVDYADKKRREGIAKLFHEIDAGVRGVRAVAFSKWFTQFLESIGARRDRTSYHSFRHNFRDELRAARVDHDVSMALGGWVGGASQPSAASENYGSGYRVALLQEGINSLRFMDIDLSHLAR
ncbi:MAG: site-specific integrase [Sphingorhabdus sp.]